MGRNHKKGRVDSHQTSKVPQAIDDYNLQTKYNAVRRYSQLSRKSLGSGFTESAYEQDFQNNAPIYDDSAKQRYTGTAFEQYAHLDDRLDSYRTQNEQQHTDLRKEFEEKLDKKLSIQWYAWTVAAIVAIASLFYILSYSKVLNSQEDHSSRIESLNVHVRKLEFEYGGMQNASEEYRDSIGK